MISQDTKDQIDRDAESWAFLLYTFDTGKRYGKRGYVEGATNYAEKLEEKDKAYNELGVKFDKEVERWQERDTDELEKRLALQTELAQLKEIAVKMSYALQEAINRQFGNTIDWNKGKQALTAYAEWCKQNLK